jgi:hypothetical protein
VTGVVDDGQADLRDLRRSPLRAFQGHNGIIIAMKEPTSVLSFQTSTTCYISGGRLLEDRFTHPT